MHKVPIFKANIPYISGKYLEIVNIVHKNGYWPFKLRQWILIMYQSTMEILNIKIWKLTRMLLVASLSNSKKVQYLSCNINTNQRFCNRHTYWEQLSKTKRTKKVHKILASSQTRHLLKCQNRVFGDQEGV